MPSALLESPQHAFNTPTPSASSSTTIQHGSSATSRLPDLLDHRRGDEPASRDDSDEDGGVLLTPVDDSSVVSSGSESSALKRARGEKIARYEAKGSARNDEHVHVPFVVKKVPYSTETSIVNERYPNEVLMHIMKNLDTATLENMALASKRFNELVNSALVWKALFFRDFPQAGAKGRGPAKRFFTPLSPNASWKDEYIHRTSLQRAASKGKLHDLQRMKEKSWKPSMSTVITYDARAGPRGTVTHISARFPERMESGEYKGFPRLVAASTDTNMVSYSDYAAGVVERNPLGRMAELNIGPIPREHPLDTTVFDVSEEVGWIHGKPVDGGQVCIFSQQSTQTPQWSCGLWNTPAFTYPSPDGPVTTTNPGTITSVWIAKSRKVGSIFKTSGAHFGALSGSSRGMLTAYELRTPTGNVFTSNSDGLAVWKICPGIPIISIQVRDAYSYKDWKAGKPWCFVTNMLGEVYYSCRLPSSIEKDVEVDWHLIPQTKRTPNEVFDAALRKRFTENEYLLFEMPWKTYSKVWEDWNCGWWSAVDWQEATVLRGKDGPATKIDRFVAKPATGVDELVWEASELSFGNGLEVDVTCHAMDNSICFTALEGQTDPDGTSIGNDARLFAVGTEEGSLYIWNARSASSSPLRQIHTTSPAVFSVALSSLYLIHGGTDGTCQVWSLFGTSQTPLRTLNAYPHSSVRAHFSALAAAQAVDPSYTDTSYAVRCITLDPDPTALRGVFGLYKNIRSFAFAAPAQNRRKKAKASRSAAAPAGNPSKRAGKAWKKVIASETRDAMARRDKEERENEMLERRFGTSWRLRGRDDLNEEEQLQLAQALSMSVEEMNAQKGGVEYAESSENGDESLSSPTPSSAGAEWGRAPDEDEEDEELARAIEASRLDSQLPPYTDPNPEPTNSEDDDLAAAIAASLAESTTQPQASSSTTFNSNTFHSPPSASASASASAASPFKIIDKRKKGKKVPLQVAEEDRFEDEIQMAIRLSLLEKSGESEGWGGEGKGKGKGKGRMV